MYLFMKSHFWLQLSYSVISARVRNLSFVLTLLLISQLDFMQTYAVRKAKVAMLARGKKRRHAKSFYHHFEGRGKPAPSHEPQPDSCQQSNMQAANNAGPEKEAKILARRTTNLCAIPFSNSWPRLAYVGNNQATVHSVRLIPASWSRKPFSHLFG